MQHYIRFVVSLALIQLLASVTFATTPAEIQTALSTRYKITTRNGFTARSNRLAPYSCSRKRDSAQMCPRL